MKPNCFSNRNSLLMPQEFNSHLLLRLDAGFTFKVCSFSVSHRSKCLLPGPLWNPLIH